MLIYLKLGGSLITDKRIAERARQAVIDSLANEIAAARQNHPDLHLIIGNGAGSFAHRPAKEYGTRNGARTSKEWYGFAETADAASRLNRLVVKSLLAAGVPAWSVQPSVELRCRDGVIEGGPAETVAMALRNGLVPVVHGDVALDSVRGATIASTEEIFTWLAENIPAYLPVDQAWSMQRWVLAGEVDGIYTADPMVETAAEHLPLITDKTLAEIESGLGESHGVDVTGGMVAKVAHSFSVLANYPALEILVCSGLKRGSVSAALSIEGTMHSEWDGTILRNESGAFGETSAA